MQFSEIFKPKKKKASQALHLVSSGTKIWNQLMMFIIIGVVPILFPHQITVENQRIVLVIVSLALGTSLVYEIIRVYLEKKQKDTSMILTIQLITSMFLLTLFLHFFGRINGPFFVLYLLTIMEAYLNRNPLVSGIIISTMIIATVTEFGWLAYLREIRLDFVSFVQLMVRIISLIFMRAYGEVFADKIISEEEARSRAQHTAERLQELTAELKQANEKLQEVSQLKDEFVSLTSHELRTPMTAISGTLSTVLDGFVGKISQETREFLQGAKNEVDRLLRMVNNLLNISRIESGRIKYEITEFDILPVIGTVLAGLQPLADERGLALVGPPAAKIRSKLPVRGDKDKLEEVLTNLIGNSLKYTEKGQVNVEWDHDKKTITLRVVDTGVGISADDQKEIFSKYYRTDKGQKKAKGTGLGLYISKIMTEGMGGKIWFESALGKGSTFFVRLPAA